MSDLFRVTPDFEYCFCDTIAARPLCHCNTLITLPLEHLKSHFVSKQFFFLQCSNKGDRPGSEGEEDLDEMTDSAEESEETEENAHSTASNAHVASVSTTAVKRPGMCVSVLLAG